VPEERAIVVEDLNAVNGDDDRVEYGRVDIGVVRNEGHRFDATGP